MKTITKEELFQSYAPSFNFEYNAEQLLKVALDRGFITLLENEDGENYIINENY